MPHSRRSWAEIRTKDRLRDLDPGTGSLAGVVTQRDLLGLIYLDAPEAVGESLR